MLAPPSTGKTTPVINLAAGEHRYVAAQPISSGSPKRFMGVRPRTFSARFGSPLSARRIISDSIQPGAIELTRTPYGETSVAKERINPKWPAFAAEYALT